MFPPLNVFGLLTGAQLQQTFAINSSKLVAQSVTYDISRSVLIFRGEVASTIDQGELIYIDFTPSLQVRAEFYATLDAQGSVLFEQTVYFYSTLAAGIGKVVLYVSYAVTTLGWISFVLGAVLRSLAGLEAMFVLQFSWLTMVCLNSVLLWPFEQTAPLRFTAGFNYAFLSSGASSSKSSSTMPHLSSFGLSSEYLANNFNITPLLLQVASLVFLLATTLRMKKFVSQNEFELKSTIASEDSTQAKKHLECYIERNELAHQLLMYCCMAFLSYFAFCSALYFRVGSVPDAASLVLFAI